MNCKERLKKYNYYFWVANYSAETSPFLMNLRWFLNYYFSVMEVLIWDGYCQGQFLCCRWFFLVCFGFVWVGFFCFFFFCYYIFHCSQQITFWICWSWNAKFNIAVWLFHCQLFTRSWLQHHIEDRIFEMVQFFSLLLKTSKFY